MLVTLYRNAMGRMIDYVVANKMKSFHPHMQPISKEKLDEIRLLNGQYYSHRLNDLVGQAIQCVRMRFPHLQEYSLGVKGGLILTALAMLVSFAWTGATSILVPMMLMGLGALFVLLVRERELIITFKNAISSDDLVRMSGGQFLLFIIRVIELLVMLMVTVLIAKPFMWLVLSGFMAWSVITFYFDVYKLMSHLEAKGLTRQELDEMVETTKSLYSPWALSQFEDSLSREIKLTVTMVQRYQHHSDSAAD